MTGNPAAIETVGSSTTLRLDGLYRRIKAGDDIVLSKGAYDRWFSVESISERTMNLINAGTISVPDEDGDLQTVTVPPVTTIVTELKLDATIDSRKASGDTNWTAADAPAIVLHYAIVEGGQVTTAAQTEVESSAALQTSQPPEKSALSAAYWPTQFILRDKNDAAVAVSGTLGEDGSLTLDPDSAWTGTLVAPLKLYGNVLQATRGEQVTGEILGSGDGSLANQTFTLKNNPLTYLSAPTQDNPQGVASTLTVWVNGIQWQEVPRFYGIGPDEMVYIVRQNSDGESSITFGDGSRGARLPTGSGNVVADYRFGAGAASPPALSITQVVKPIKGLNTVNNPVPAYGGADAESEEQTRQYAPRSALMLGRAVSLLDFEAVVANVMGVTAVTVDWRWNTNQQRPLVQVWYIGDANLKDTVLASLRAYSELNTPFDVQVAQPQPVTLTLDLLADPRYVLANVISAAQEVLLGDSGILLPQNIGISGTFFRSPLLAALSAVEGLVTVRALLWDGAPLPDYGVRAPAGYYFEFKVSINGEAVS